MAEDEPPPSPGPDPPSPEPGPQGRPPHRPAPESRGAGRWLRGVAGIREDILDWVPEERARYTRLGAIILNTGCMASLALLVTLDRFLEVPWFWFLPIALFWGWLIVCIDAWLVTSTHGMSGARRLRVLVPRLLLATLIGLAIAEPLMLRVFRPAIHQEVRDERSRDLADYESRLVACNPVTGAPADPKKCGEQDARLSVPGSPDELREELTMITKQRDDLAELVAKISAEWQRLEDVARRECAGASGDGLSGRAGEGPRCERNRSIADRYRIDSRLPERQAELASLNQEVSRLTGELGTATENHGQEISRQIAASVQERRSNQREIGILDEHRALGRLSAQSAFVLAAQWVLRLLLLAVDSLPVLAKLMSGTTTYDRLLNRQLATDEHLHDMEDRLRRRRDTAGKEVEIRRIEDEVRSRMEEIAKTDRDHGVQRNTDIDAAIDKLTNHYRRQGTSPFTAADQSFGDGWRGPHPEYNGGPDRDGVASKDADGPRGSTVA